MKISELTDDIVREFCGIDEESKLLPVFRAAALGFITGYTGLTAEEIDEHEDITQGRMETAVPSLGKLASGVRL